MLLCIDIGNTNTVLATFEGDKLVHSLADQDRRPVHRRRAGADVPRAARRRRGGDHRHRGLLDRAGGAAVAAHDAARATTPTCRAVIVEPGVRTGVQLAIDNPKEVGADRVVNTLAAFTPLRRAVDRGRLRHHDELRRDQRAGRVPRRRVRARHRDLVRRAGRAGRPAAQGRAGQAALGDRQEHRGVPAVRACTSASPARSTGIVERHDRGAGRR